MLSELGLAFARSLKQAQDALYKDTASRGWFTARPDQVRRRWLIIYSPPGRSRLSWRPLAATRLGGCRPYCLIGAQNRPFCHASGLAGAPATRRPVVKGSGNSPDRQAGQRHEAAVSGGRTAPGMRRAPGACA